MSPPSRRRGERIEIRVDQQVALTLGNTVEQHSHDVGRAVLHVFFSIFTQLMLHFPQYHAVQPPQLCPHAALRQCGVPDAVPSGLVFIGS